MAASSKMAIRHRSRSIPALAFGPADTADFSTLLRRCVTCKKQAHWLLYTPEERIIHIFHQIDRNSLFVNLGRTFAPKIPQHLMPRQLKHLMYTA